MDTKIKNNTSTNSASSGLIFGGLKYQKIDSGWGLIGLFEGYRLVFSAVFTKSRFGLEEIKKFFGPAKRPQKSIITNIDLFKLFSKDSAKAWGQAYNFARKRKQQPTPEDVFLALLGSAPVKILFNRLNLSAATTKTFFKNSVNLNSVSGAEEIKKVPFEAFALATKLHNQTIDPLMLLAGVLKCAPKGGAVSTIFSNLGLSMEKLELYCVWALNLNYEFPKNSPSGKLLYCCRQAQALEEHFGYFFQLPAIQTALELSSNQTLKDLEHKKALQILVKAAGLAKKKPTKIITVKLVRQAVI